MGHREEKRMVERTVMVTYCDECGREQTEDSQGWIEMDYNHFTGTARKLFCSVGCVAMHYTRLVLDTGHPRIG